MLPSELKDRLANSAFAFRGYNITNLGRSRELLRHPRYGETVREFLERASLTCREVTGRKCDLVKRVSAGRETTLRTYADAIAMIVAMELAQLELLERFFGISFTATKMCYGYSLGEITAVIAAGTMPFEDAIRVPLSLAKDCVKLAEGVTLGVLFSRGPALSMEQVQRQCLLVNSEGRGVLGVSTHLSPNSLLILGQSDTLSRFKKRIDDVTPHRVFLRRDKNEWPPLHTPILWEKNIPNRAAYMMHAIQGGFTEPNPPIYSLVTGTPGYNDFNTRDILHRWIDHPQRLWDAVYETLARNIGTVVHVGPQPNIFPATFHRLSENVEAQAQGSISLRALTAASRTWLKKLLPQRTALLNAPKLQHVTLEDFLLENEPTEDNGS